MAVWAARYLDEDEGGLGRSPAHHLGLDCPGEGLAVGLDKLLCDAGVDLLRVQQQAIHVKQHRVNRSSRRCSLHLPYHFNLKSNKVMIKETNK